MTPGGRTRSSGRRAPRRRDTTSTALPPIRSYAPLLDLREAEEQHSANEARITAAGVVGMKRAAIWLLAWGAWLGVLTGLQAAFEPKAIQFAIPGVASTACIASGLGAVGSREEPRARRAPRG